MPVNQQRRQKKLLRQRNKRKAEKKQLARDHQGGLARAFSLAASAPVLHSCVPESLWDDGIGQVLFSRKLRTGQVAFVNFLIDSYCLGVKNVIANVTTESKYRSDMYERLDSKFGLRDVPPAYVRKLVEEAVDYAGNLNLAPHREYHAARMIFGDINPEDCHEEFRFGKDGKPCFVSGPYDTPARCHQIISILRNVCGQDNFDVVMHVSADDLDDMLLDEDEETDGFFGGQD